MKKTTWLIFVVSFCVSALAVATVVKQALNCLCLNKEDLVCHSIEEARARKTLLSEFCIDPKVIVYKGQEIEFEDAWIEESTELVHRMVWFPSFAPTGHRYLVLTINRGHQVFGLLHSPFLVLEDNHKGLTTVLGDEEVFQFQQLIEDPDRLDLRVYLRESWDEKSPSAIIQLQKKGTRKSGDAFGKP